MQSLEIRNPDEFLSNFQQMSASVRTFPAMFMVAATSKIIIGLITTIGIFVAVLIGGWKVAEKNERHQELRRQDFQGVASRNPDFNYTNRTQVNDPIEMA